MARALLWSAAMTVLLAPPAVHARVNATGAVATFLISDCAACTTDENSIFCSEAKGGDDDNFVANTTVKVTIRMKKTQAQWNLNNPTTPLGPADGAKYCWSGTFGRLLSNNGNYTDLLGTASVLAQLDCQTRNLFYRQCIIPSEMAIILMVVGGIVVVGGTSLILFCCGCCRCCNEKGDDSKYGCCNRFCPWCTMCADKHLREVEVKVEHESERSLTGKSNKLNEAYTKSLTEKSGDKAPEATVSNPLMASSLASRRPPV